MTRSLAEDLRTLAQSGPADPGVAIADRAGQMVRAIRRRRAARQTGMSAVGVSAAAAVVFGVTNGPPWLTVGPATDGDAGDVTTSASTAEPTETPTETSTGEPTGASTPLPTPSEPAPPEPTGAATDPAVPDAPLTPGLQLIADQYGLDLSCGATFTHETASAVGGRGADHLTPAITVDPTRADQPLTVTNGIPDEGYPMDGYTRMTPVAVIARDGVIVGWGGGDAVSAERDRVVMTYAIELGGLHQCAEPPMAADGLGTYTIWVLASESGFGLPDDVEGLSFAAGLRFDLATGAWDYVVD